jgi:hypothetical protein
MVGDLVEFGSQHHRLLILDIADEASDFSVNASGRIYRGNFLNLLVLVARHGEKPKEASRGGHAD